MNKRISVAGLGKLGLAFSLLADSVGYKVYGCETNQKRLKQIKDGTLKTTEPYVEHFLGMSKMHVTDNLLEVYKATDILFIFVATPSNSDGSYNHDQIESVLNAIYEGQEGIVMSDKTIVICCTTMPGYCQSVKDKFHRWRQNIVYNPEFISAGNIVNGLKFSDIVLIGGNPPEKLLEFYRDIMINKPNFKIMPLTAAEISKIGINCFLSLKISYCNLLGEIAINSGQEDFVDNILEAVGSDSRIGNKFFKYGFGYGGQCIPRDMNALGLHATKVGLSNDFQKQIDKSNDEHNQYLKNYWIAKSPNKDVPFIFSHVSFKPGTEITTESQQLRLCIDLLKDGYKVVIESNIPKELEEFGENVLVLPSENGIRIN